MIPKAHAGAEALADLPCELRGPLLDCARGRLPANVALMHLLSTERSAEDIARAIGAAAAQPGQGAERIRELQRLWRATPEAGAKVRAVLAAVAEGGRPRAPQQWAAVFDRAAAVSPAPIPVGVPALAGRASLPVGAGPGAPSPFGRGLG